jgi:hypothetical protein
VRDSLLRGLSVSSGGGIRTGDLLYDKQDERIPLCTDITCKRAVLGHGAPS